MAIGAAIATPYIAAGIDRRRRRAAAVRLAQLICEATEAIAAISGAERRLPIEKIDDAIVTLNLPALLDRADAFPSDNVDRAEALDAFVRVTGAARATLRNRNNLQADGLSPDSRAAMLSQMPALRDRAFAELERMKRALSWRPT